MLSVDLALVWTSAEEVAEQPVAGGLPGAAPSVEVYVDQDLGQQDKVRVSGEGQSCSSKQDCGGAATASRSRSALFYCLQETTSFSQDINQNFGNCSFYPKGQHLQPQCVEHLLCAGPCPVHSTCN